MGKEEKKKIPTGGYTSENITVLEGLEPVRKRPVCILVPLRKPVYTILSGKL